VKTEVHSGIDAPELEGLPCLYIVEREERNGAVVFQYVLRLLPGEPAVSFESARIKNRQRTISTILDDVASIWKNTDGEPEEREQKLQDIGSKLFDELFPVEMQAYLWKHRAKLKDLIVYADEPFVPWELVHLKPPDGPRPTEPQFLAQNGLVRWHLNSFPPRQIRVRKGHAKSLCPEYRDPQFALTEPVHERRYLEDRFGASPVTATPTGVRTLLRSGRFDLLHFSGHGAASSGKILDAKLLLQGRKRGGTVEPQYFGATTVSENAKPAGKNGVGPVVVLNACQVGQAGELLTTVGGFAKAFLDAGASAFVSCLWSVHQEPSRVFVEKLYDELLDGTPIGTASARARQEARKAGDATWLAFVVYARPDAVLVRS
jgi:CHAT domain